MTTAKHEWHVTSLGEDHIVYICPRCGYQILDPQNLKVTPDICPECNTQMDNSDLQRKTLVAKKNSEVVYYRG